MQIFLILSYTIINSLRIVAPICNIYDQLLTCCTNCMRIFIPKKFAIAELTLQVIQWWYSVGHISLFISRL